VSYVPMSGPLPGERYMPSNGTEGHSFIECWCAGCHRDRAMSQGVDFDECDDDERCEILGASFRGEAQEWRELEDGRHVCLAFIPAGEALTTPRCEFTADMFEAVQ
jgi:hypothetical protein